MAKDRTLGLKLRAIDRMSGAIDRVQRKFPKLTRSIRRAQTTVKIFNAQTKQMRQSMMKVGNGMKRFGTAMAIGVTLPVLAAGAAGVKTFGDYEQGLRGVEKTTGLASGTVAQLGERFDQLSTEIPVTTMEMLELAQAAGQMDVKGAKNIEKFTLTMAKLGRASDVAGEQGAKSIARILTVTGDGIQKVDQFSSALVKLGNTTAASESEILEVTTRIAGQIGRFDVSSAKTLGLGSALKALGKQAEASGSVIGKSFDAIDQAIQKGGVRLKVVSKLTGIAEKDLSKAFKDDAANVFQRFVSGLNRVQTGGGNMVKVLSAIDLSGTRVNDILGTLSKRPEVLADSMKKATEAFDENKALQAEFAVQAGSFNSGMIKLGNTFKSLGRLIGQELAPAVVFFADIFKNILNFLRNNPTIRTLVIVFGALAAVMGPILLAFGAFLVILPSMAAGAAALGVALLPLTIKFVAISAAVIGLIALSVVLIKKWSALTEWFSKNPFAQVAKTMFFLLTPIGRVIAGIKLITAAFQDLNAVKDSLRDILPKAVADKFFGKKELGAEVGVRKRTQGIATGQGQQTIDNFQGTLGIQLAGFPQGTNAKARTEGPIDLDIGFAEGVI